MFIVIYKCGEPMWKSTDGFLYFNRRRVTVFKTKAEATKAIKLTTTDCKKSSEFSVIENYRLARCYAINGKAMP